MSHELDTTTKIPAVGTREPWSTPTLINSNEARDSEAGILVGPEILILLS